jgi:putative FmdB family regulatory protein
MPTYEYECSACGHSLEALQSFSEKPLKDCPKCGKSALSRLIGSGGGVIFKGSGFYETDYKKKTPPPEKKTETPAASCPKADSCPMKASGQCG